MVQLNFCAKYHEFATTSYFEAIIYIVESNDKIFFKPSYLEEHRTLGHHARSGDGAELVSCDGCIEISRRAFIQINVQVTRAFAANANPCLLYTARCV